MSITAYEGPAGCGKTHSVMEELRAALIESPLLPHQRVLALTFMHVEMRMVQEAFRNRVGERCGWRCAVTGCAIVEILDSAHLPGRDWRKHNEAGDGILLRADIHRLIDRGLATIEERRFRVSEAAKKEYGNLDGRLLY